MNWNAEMQTRYLKVQILGWDKAFLLFLVSAIICFTSPVLAKESQSLDLIVNKGCQPNVIQETYVQDGIERIYQAYLSLGQKLPARQKLKTHLFCTTQSFSRYRKLKESNAHSLSGYYSKRYQELVINASYGEARAMRTIFHESSHHFFNQIFLDPPQWFNEGMAEYFENARPTLEGLDVSPQTQKEKRLQQWLLRHQLPDLHSLFSLSSSDWQAWNRKDLRASSMSWGLIYFLMDQPFGRSLVGEMLSNTSGFTFTEDLLNYKYPGGLKQLESDWHVWLQNKHKNHHWVLSPRSK